MINCEMPESITQMKDIKTEVMIQTKILSKLLGGNNCEKMRVKVIPELTVPGTSSNVWL